MDAAFNNADRKQKSKSTKKMEQDGFLSDDCEEKSDKTQPSEPSSSSNSLKQAQNINKGDQNVQNASQSQNKPPEKENEKTVKTSKKYEDNRGFGNYPHRRRPKKSHYQELIKSESDSDSETIFSFGRSMIAKANKEKDDRMLESNDIR